ncbi:hypothetical protein [Streptomyces sp. NPDC101455]|uniref:hypothetical protein n=1 Tax=Streptomyces sp. NPDC101455 TaxID=3366142 RepID=UPI00381039F8
MTACPICPRTAPDGQHLCQLHAGELRGWLTEIPAQALLLAEEFVARSTRPAQGRVGGTGHAVAPVPVDLRVLTLLGPGRYDPIPGTDDDGQPPITATLGAWAGHIAYHHPATHRDPHGTAHTQPCEQASPRHGETITGWCTWLTAYLPYTLTLPLAPGLYGALDTLVRHLRNLTHSQPQQHPRAAPCPACQAFRLTATDGRWHIHCLGCGHQLTPDQYEQHATAFLHSLDKDPDTVSH